MKKLIVLPIFLVSMIFAQGFYAQEMTQIEEGTEMMAQDEYVEVAIENLPQPVLDAVASDYAGATITSAAAKEDASEYKLTLTMEEGESMDVYCDPDGNWITKE